MADWKTSRIPGALKEVMWAGDQLAVKPVSSPTETVATPAPPAQIQDATPAEAPAPTLSNRKQLVLQALLSLKAFDSDSRRTIPEVARKAEGKEANPDLFKKLVSQLKDSKLTDSTGGRNGGIWLTEQGRERAESLSKRW